jgi:hypothetical protein
VEVLLRPVGRVAPDEVASSDLLVIGAPTHAHSLSRPATRTAAETWSRDPEQHLVLEPDALGTGVREFLRDMGGGHAAFVAFDTRADAPELFTGSAARAIRKRLLKARRVPLLPAQSFVVATDSRLVPGELEKAEALGRTIVAAARRTQPAAPV